MIIGQDPNALQLDDRVILRMEPQAGLGEITKLKDSLRWDQEIYWCTFPNRSDGFFLREDLHCDRLDGRIV